MQQERGAAGEHELAAAPDLRERPVDEGNIGLERPPGALAQAGSVVHLRVKPDELQLPAADGLFLCRAFSARQAVESHFLAPARALPCVLERVLAYGAEFGREPVA